MKNVFKLPLRQVTGFMESLFKTAKIDLKIPDYTTLSRRAGKLKLKIEQVDRSQTLIIDGSGLKCSGDGEWTRKKHGVNKKRIWRRLTLGINESNQIVGVKLTHTCKGELSVFEEILKQYIENNKLNELKVFLGDGLYDNKKVYEILQKYNCENILIPTRINASKDTWP